MVAYAQANTVQAAEHQGFDDGYFGNEKLGRFKYPKHRDAYEGEYRRGAKQRAEADKARGVVPAKKAKGKV